LVPICLYCLNCTDFGQLILKKIIKIVATRYHILRLKCTKFDFGWGSAPDPAGGAYSWIKGGLLLREGKGERGKGREGKRKEGRGGETREGEGERNGGGKVKERGRGSEFGIHNF